MKNKIKSYETKIESYVDPEKSQYITYDETFYVKIPEELLDSLGWKEDDNLKWTVTNNAVILTRIIDVL
jgi:hypothetical protein